MCVVSMIMDHYQEKFKPYIYPTVSPDMIRPLTEIPLLVTRGEFDQLKKDVAEMKELLKKAQLYDQKNNEPDCGLEDKIELMKKIGQLVGIDLEEIFARK